MTGASTYNPATSSASFVEPKSMGITDTVGRAKLAAITAAILHGHLHILPLTVSCLSIKSGSTCCTMSFTATKHKGRYSYKLFATHQTLRTFLRSNPTTALLVMSVQILWLSIRQVNTSHADTGMPCVSINGYPFYDKIWVAFEINTPLNAKILRVIDPLTLKLQYFSNLQCSEGTEAL